LNSLAEAGLDHVQLSIQAGDATTADSIAQLKGAHEQKLVFARRVVEFGLPLTVNAVIHRGNIGSVSALIDLAIDVGAKRIEIAHTQYYGWAYVNRAALMPARADVDRSIDLVEAARERLQGQLVIDLVVPDYYATYPKACAGGWGRRLMNVSPSGKVLPCHAAETIPNLTFWNVLDYSLAEIWARSPAFEAFRGTGWMQEPCRSCERRERDWGGCRCQALALTGDASATDPACSRSPYHARIQELATSESGSASPPDYVYRTIGRTLAPSA
jgi:pyrroloquinoline quinone biosynthesis protein E